jgi:hypothetical protein
MHPYRGGPPGQTLDDDEDVRRFARRARRQQRISVAVALGAALVLAYGLVDWPFAAYVLSGEVLVR